MTNRIDKKYFSSGLLYIPNLEQNNGFDESLNANANENLRKLIATHQKRFFLYVLGKDLYDEFAESEDDAKWSDMLEQLIDDENKTSPLANYVYFQHLAESATHITQAGAVKTKTDNMMIVSPKERQVSAWNQMCDMMEEFFEWLEDNRETIETVNDICSAYHYKLTTKKNVLGI